MKPALLIIKKKGARSSSFSGKNRGYPQHARSAPGGTDLQGKWPLLSAGTGASAALWRGAARWRRRACGRPVALGREEGEAGSASRTHTCGPPRPPAPVARGAQAQAGQAAPWPVLLELKTGRERGVRAASPALPAPFCSLVLQHLKSM